MALTSAPPLLQPPGATNGVTVAAPARSGGAATGAPARTLLRLAATLLLVWELLSLVVGNFHPAREPANDHAAVFGSVIAWTARIPRPVGYLMGLSGLAYLAQGWVLGTEGFSVTNRLPTLLGIVLVLVWSVWLLITAWRMKASVTAPTR